MTTATAAENRQDRLHDLGGWPRPVDVVGDGVLPVSAPTAAAAALGDEPETTGTGWASGRIRSDAKSFAAASEQHQHAALT